MTRILTALRLFSDLLTAAFVVVAVAGLYVIAIAYTDAVHAALCASLPVVGVLFVWGRIRYARLLRRGVWINKVKYEDVWRDD